uniref:Putative ovule protein n=1 Tax=Solanum chacoense TaxID=4108 RepID=A0A0V0GWC7_SOLCH
MFYSTIYSSLPNKLRIFFLRLFTIIRSSKGRYPKILGVSMNDELGLDFIILVVALLGLWIVWACCMLKL